MNNKQLKDPRTYKVISAAMEVHRIMGPGFLEAVYHLAMCIECSLRCLPFKKEVELPVRYKDKLLATSYRADLVCFNDVLVEIKALGQLTTKEDSQIINYLKATGLQTGLLLNFGSRSLEFKRFVLTDKNVLPVFDPD